MNYELPKTQAQDKRVSVEVCRMQSYILHPKSYILYRAASGEAAKRAPREGMEPSGLEPLTSWVRSRRSPS